MRKTREYIAFYDNGHGYGEFEYFSEFRLNSKGNMNDAIITFIRKYGRVQWHKTRIYQTQRKEWL